MSEDRTARQYDRWLRRPSISGKGYEFLASVPGSMFVNTPVFRLDQTLQLRPSQRLLDVGCGRASLLQVLASKVRFDAPPTGIDLSLEMLRRAHRETEALPGGLHLAMASGLQMPFHADTFDVITCSYVIKHLDDAGLRCLFAEILRVLKPGGLALVWEFGPTHSPRLDQWNRWVLTRGVDSCNFRSFAEVVAAGTSAGFEWVENAHLRPFLLPPIPRVSVLLGKAPEEWRRRTGPGRARRAPATAAGTQAPETTGTESAP